MARQNFSAKLTTARQEIAGLKKDCEKALHEAEKWKQALFRVTGHLHGTRILVHDDPEQLALEAIAKIERERVEYKEEIAHKDGKVDAFRESMRAVLENLAPDR